MSKTMCRCDSGRCGHEAPYPDGFCSVCRAEAGLNCLWTWHYDEPPGELADVADPTIAACEKPPFGAAMTRLAILAAAAALAVWLTRSRRREWADRRQAFLDHLEAIGCEP